MRFGNAIIFLCVAFIGLGFLLSDDLHIRAGLGNVRQELAQAQGEKQSMQDQLFAATTAIEELNRRVEEFARQVLVLQNELSQQQAENEVLTENITRLQRQVAQYEAVAPISKYFVNLFASPMSIAIFLPILPLAAISYVLVRAGKKENLHIDPADPSCKDQGRIWVQLTRDEIKELVNKRRSEP